MAGMRFGIDLGGTKTELLALGPDGSERLRRRVPTVQEYEPIIRGIRDLVLAAESELGERGTVGVGIPGCLSPATGLVKGGNTQCLNGRPLDKDLGEALGRPVRIANDANCMALSEASDGAAAGAKVVFGVILGTGVGGGLVVDGRVIEGRHGVAGEWGHMPLPWPEPAELPFPRCWCGRPGCLEMFLSGPGLVADAGDPGGRDLRAVLRRAEEGEAAARGALDRHVDRVARAFSVVIDVIDPDAIVIGGGVSNLDHLYTEVPKLLPRHVFSDVVTTPILRAKHGDSSGVRGAAWLWSREDAVSLS